MPHPVDVMPEEGCVNPRRNTEAGRSNTPNPFWDARHDDKTRRARTHGHDTHASVDRLRRRHFTIGTDELKMRDSFRFEAAARSVAFVRPGGEEGGREGGRRRRPMEESALRRADWPARRGRIFQADRSEPNLLSGEEERRTEGGRARGEEDEGRPPARTADRPTDTYVAPTFR